MQFRKLIALSLIFALLFTTVSTRTFAADDVDQQNVETYTFDENGNLIVNNSESDSEPDEVDETGSNCAADDENNDVDNVQNDESTESVPEAENDDQLTESSNNIDNTNSDDTIANNGNNQDESANIEEPEEQVSPDENVEPDDVPQDEVEEEVIPDGVEEDDQAIEKEELIEQTAYDALMQASTLEEMFVLLMREEYRTDVLSFTVEEIDALISHTNDIYGLIKSPTAEDTEYRDILVETFSTLPAMACTECGLFGEHSEDCVKNTANLVSNPQNGMTLTGDATIGKQTLNSRTEIRWVIPEGITLTITGTVLLQKNTTLIITGGGTIKRSTNSTLFDIEDTCTITLNGVTVDGFGQSFDYPLIQTTADDKVSHINIINTTIQNITIGPKYNRGLITIFCNSNKKGSKSIISISDSVFNNCSAVTGAAILFQDNSKGTLTISNTLFSNNNTSQGGVIRTSGSSGVALSLNQCVFKNNTGNNNLFSSVASYTNGAAIYWNACGSDLSGNRSLAQIKDCQFINNKIIYSGSSVEDGCGGAIYNEAFMSLSSAYVSGFLYSESTPGNIVGNLVSGNSASNMGGGIMVPTYSGGMSAHIGIGATLNLDASTIVLNNTAKKGGGLAMSVGLGSVGGSDPENSGVEYSIICDGAVISGNSASVIGGGIYLEREAGHDYFPSTINLISGSITNNTAPSGGGIAIYNASQQTSTKTNEINIGQNNGDNSQLIISDNTATSNGGGAIYISYGDVKMFGGTIRDNHAQNGGAISINHGNFTINNGAISFNTAAQNGGAVQVANGHCYVFGGEMLSNSAIDGGAIYLSGGDIDIYNGSISNNNAENNGGAVYVDTDSINVEINIYDGEIINNTAKNHGGAIGAKASNGFAITLSIGKSTCDSKTHIDHEDGVCPQILNNTSGVYGGAFCLHGDDLAINVYCGQVTGNIAMRNPGSNTLQQGGGVVNVYSGTLDAGLMIGGGEFIDHRIDARQITIRFWGNYNGAPSAPKTVQVTDGVTVSFPLDIYGREGHFLTGWSTSPNASGIYIPANGKYLIDTDQNVIDFYAVWDVESTYIVYIPDTLEIDDSMSGSMNIRADLNYFLELSTIDITITTDFLLKYENDNSITLPFTLHSSECGMLKSGDVAATFQYDNYIEKIITATIDSSNLSLYCGKYFGYITFVVDYYIKQES